MRLNILIAICAGLLTYGLTVYLDSGSPPGKPESVEAPLSGDSPDLGAETPAFSFTDINGESRNIRDFEGKIVILNFWASWCPPCIKEFPLLLDAAANHKDDVVLIALSSDHDKQAMNRFINSLKKDFDLDSMPNVHIALD